MTLNIVEIRGFTSCCGILPSPPSFLINNFIQIVKNFGMTFEEAGKKFEKLGESLKKLEKKEFEEHREDEQEYLEIESIFFYCQKDDCWNEMSYNQYDQNLLDFNYDEYSDGDWNNE